MQEVTLAVWVATVKPTLLLVSTNRWLSPVRLAESFADLECAVQAVCTPRNALWVSSAVRGKHRYSSFKPLLSIDAGIEAADPDLVVPCDDLATAHLHALYGRDTCHGSLSPARKAALLVRSLGLPASHPIIASRQKFLALAREEGVLVPDSALTPDLNALDQWMLAKGLPLVLKTDWTSGGQGVRIVNTRQQAQRAFRELASPRAIGRIAKGILMDGAGPTLARLFRHEQPPVSAHQFVAGQDANVALACWRGEVLAQIAAMVLKTRSPNGPAAVIRLIENVQMSDAVKKLVRRLGLSGFVGFDFVVEDATGKAFLIEINPRATQTCHLQLHPGSNLCAALCASLSASATAKKNDGVTPYQTIVLWPQLADRLLPAHVVDNAYFDKPQNDPEVVRLFGSSKRVTFSNVIKSLWRSAWARAPL